MFSLFKRSRLVRGLTLAGIPVLLLGAGVGVAAAATSTLTVTVINRNGAKVSAGVKVVDVRSSQLYSVRSGTARKLPAGTYAVLTSITTGDTVTLSGKAVKVSGSTKLTVDARQGKSVGLGLSPVPKGLDYQLSMRVCTRTSASEDVEISATPPTKLYVIPHSSAYLGFAALGSWSDHNGGPAAYSVMHQTTGVPGGLGRTFAQKDLAKIRVVQKRGPSGSIYSDLAMQPLTSGCGNDLYAGLGGTDKPTITTVYASPGTWDVRVSSSAPTKTGETWNIGSYFAKRTVASGKSYNLSFFNSAWGPSARLPQTINGRIQYNLNEGFTDPSFPRDGSVEGGDKALTTVQFEGKTVTTKQDKGWEPESTDLYYTVKKAGWYTLTNTATRYYPEITFPSSMMSTTTRATYRFLAKPGASELAGVYSVQMFPTGLSMTNRAAPSSTTKVAITMLRGTFDPDANLGTNPKLSKLTAQMSPDSGNTWRTVPVQKIGATWYALVPNSKSSFVALKVRATMTTGAYTEATVFRAYGIG
ncbi:hypothetical protein KOI35_05135 [Actinoplanes bogorensis]|uniref:Uncharacterized protein n=1 Tax=Paractinoplanes bogorensis TaxID=1610840 RepID=A0ABS5YHR1_9ACTN|nr:hypothetical protein [Actinoplanes bogorensis]MBU2662887.1 hypothetical protein [Actinoplanes bogorensis]